MTGPDSEPDLDPDRGSESVTTNTAESGATVGIQASSVHNSNVYFVQPDASPREKFDIGVRYLEGGVPSEARRLIGEAIASGHDTTEARFHLVLALLSRRSDRDLTTHDREQLDRMSAPAPGDSSDEWTKPLGVISGLLAQMRDPGSEPGPMLLQLDGLPIEQQTTILRHLDLMLSGVMKDHLWGTTHEEAERDRLDNNRVNRAWAYFHPEPALPRARILADDPPPLGEWFRTVSAVGIAAVAFSRLAWAVLDDGAPLSIPTLLLVVAAGVTGGYTGQEWHYRAARLAEREREYASNRSLRPVAAGFAKQVEHRFQYYSHKYAPPEPDGERWLSQTAGVRSTLRDEIADLYRGSSKIAEVNWLIRHLVADVRDQWNAGTLHAYRARYRTPLVLKAICIASTSVLMLAALMVMLTATRVDPVLSILALPVAVLGGWAAAGTTLHMIGSYRRRTEDHQDYQRTLAARDQAYRRWKKRLDEARPEEREMERWLDSDRKIFLGEALSNYRLAWRDVIAHAVLQAPAKSYKRAKVQSGPWRYSKYDLRLFLITRDGVREVGSELDFAKATTGGQERTNFRFEAVSSVRVAVDPDSRYVLELTLTNGPTRRFLIIDAAAGTADDADQDTDQRADPGDQTDDPTVDLDAAGFAHALHVLEGMAAEGRGWIGRDSYASRPRDPAPLRA